MTRSEARSSHRIVTTAGPRAGVRHIAAVDGLRGLAVMAVVGYHAEISWLDGGFLGVELFFVVSGFLVTSLLLVDHVADGGLHLKSFWWRRITRLWPATLTLIGFMSLYAAAAAPDAVPALRADVISAAIAGSNWGELLAGQSYFEATGRPPLLRHLWSVAVEYQLYLIWPLVAAVVLRRHGRGRLAVVAGGGALASTLVMAAAVNIDSPSRVYYGTDTRASGFLVGAALACTGIALRPPTPHPHARIAIDGAALAAMAMVLAELRGRSEYQPSLYRGGFFTFAAAVALVVFAASIPGSLMSRMLSRGPLVAVGLRSYSLYLWHWPVFQLMRPGMDVGLRGMPALASRLLVTAALSEVSFRIVERRAMRFLRTSEALHAGRRLGLVSVSVLLTCMVLLNESDGALLSRSRQTPAIPHTPTAITPPHTESPTTTLNEADTFVPVHAVGDSVLLSASDALISALDVPVSVDAAIGRQPEEGVDLIEAWAPGNPHVALVVALGNNGVVRVEHVQRIITAAAPGRRLVFVNTAVPRRWRDVSNRALADAVRRHPDARLVDWSSMVAHSPEIIGPDGIHPTGAGSVALAGAIAQALA